MAATPEESRFIPPHGRYRELLSYQKAEVIYDLTYRFCQRFLLRGDRTIDQMVQAARSGKQNIVEGSQAAGTSKETEIELANVARASLEELLTDYDVTYPLGPSNGRLPGKGKCCIRVSEAVLTAAAADGSAVIAAPQGIAPVASPPLRVASAR